MKEKWANGDGTYDGAQMLADLSGLTRAEIDWTWKRLKELLDSGMSRKEAKAKVGAEAVTRPWEGDL